MTTQKRAAPKPVWWPHEPHFRQAVALYRHGRAPDLMFGGAAGGGKSDFLLMDASMHCHHSDYRGLLLRRTYRDLSLPGALMDRAVSWWAGRYGIRWNATEHRLTWPSGAELVFGHMDDSQAHLDYQGAELDFIGIDEASQIPETQLRYLHSRLRRNRGSDIPVRYRVATNPGGRSHDYLKRTFVQGDGVHQVYVPALIADNPYLDADEYRDRLARLDPITRRQLELGDWDASFTTGFFEVDNIARLDEAPPGVTWLRAWDYAATPPSDANPDPDYTVGVLVGVTPDSRIIIADVQRMRVGPAGVDAALRSAAERDGRDVPVVAEQEPGSSGKFVADRHRLLLNGYRYTAVPSTGSKLDRAKPFAGAMAHGDVLVTAALADSVAWDDVLQELRHFPEGAHDDAVDALSLAYNRLVAHTSPRAWTFL